MIYNNKTLFALTTNLKYVQIHIQTLNAHYQQTRETLGICKVRNTLPGKEQLPCQVR